MKASGGDADLADVSVDSAAGCQEPHLQVRGHIGRVKPRGRAEGQPSAHAAFALKRRYPCTVAGGSLGVQDGARPRPFAAIARIRRRDARGAEQGDDDLRGRILPQHPRCEIAADCSPVWLRGGADRVDLERVFSVPGFASRLTARLTAGFVTNAEQELELLRDAARTGLQPRTPGAGKVRSAAKTTLRCDVPAGTVRCAARDGKVEMVMERDFSAIDRHRLEAAVAAFMAELDD